MKPPFDPILIEFGENTGIGIHWYGLLIVVGVMLGAAYAAWRARRDGENPEHVWNALTVAILLGIVGGRLYHVFSSPQGGMVGWDYYRQNPRAIFAIWDGGLGIYGAIVGGALGAVIYCWLAKLRPLQWLDYGAPGLALGQFVGRWGNFINQELYGPPTDLPWGLLIDPEHRIAPYNDLTAYPPDTLFHPTFLYESLWCLLVFGVLVFVSLKLKDRLLEGDIFLGYLIGYPLGRFFIEYLRPDAWMIGPISAAQLFAVLSIVAALAVLIVRHATGRPAAAGVREESAPAGVESGDGSAPALKDQGGDDEDDGMEAQAGQASELSGEPAGDD